MASGMGGHCGRWVLRSALLAIAPGWGCSRQEPGSAVGGDAASAEGRTFTACSGGNSPASDSGLIATPCCPSGAVPDGGARTIATFPYAPPQTAGSASNLASDGSNLYALVGTSSYTLVSPTSLAGVYGQLVVRFPLPCGAPTILASSSGPGGSAFAVARGYAYWATDTSILSVSTMGGATNTVADGLSAPLDIAVHDDRLYWIDIAGVLSAVPIAGATPEVLASGFGNRNLGGLAVDDSNVYFTERCSPSDASCPAPGPSTGASGVGTGRLLSVPLAGGALTTLADQQLNPAGVIVDSDNIYWINAGTSGRDTPDPNGSVLTMSKSGGTPSGLVGGEEAPRSLHLEGTALYWISGSGVEGLTTAIRKLTVGGAASNFGPLGGGKVFVFTVDASQVYVGTLDGILAAPN